MSEKKEEGEETTEAKPKSKKKLIIIVLALVLIVVGAGVPMFLMGGKKTAETEEEHEAPKKLETADLGQFIVNLSETSSFLKVHITIEYDASILDHHLEDKGHAGGKGEGGGAAGGGEGKEGGLHPFLTKRQTQIQDTIIRVLSAKHAEELLTQEGKERLKDELVEGINEAVATEEPAITAVYFTEFIIQ
jgi:flagellar FliL protein